MSQIDKAFLNAYAKKRPSAPSSTEVRPLVDPTGERLLKIHSAVAKTETLQPHIAPSPIAPKAPAASIAPQSQPATKSVPATSPPSVNLPTQPTATVLGKSIHISPSAVRIASSSSIRNVPKSDFAAEPKVAAPIHRAETPRPHQPTLPPVPPHQKVAKQVTPLSQPTLPSASTLETEPAPRKTLTSYLQQARQSNSIPPLKTRWSPEAPASPSIQTSATTSTQNAEKPKSASDIRTIPSAPGQQFRVDARHANYPPVSRPESTIPWSFGTVERSIKATADSKSVSARTANEYHAADETADETQQTEAEPIVVVPAAQEPKPESFVSPQLEAKREPSPMGKSLNAESLTKITLPIEPVWEVDEFLWPSATANLISTQAEAFHEIGLHLQHAQSKGLRVLSVTSGERGVGRSTTAMCLAKTMSKLGMRIALFDGDYECPSLVDHLNLEAQNGWQQCILENIPLDEVAIHAVEEAITLFPLTDSIAASQIAIHSLRINKLIKRISNAYDMVIIDANRLTQKQSQLLGTGDEAVLNAALLIVDAELSLRQRVDAAIEMVRSQGVESIGLVENFHS